LCIPPIISRPLSNRSAKTSKYQAMSPRYSVNDGAVGSQLPKMKPLYSVTWGTWTQPHDSLSSSPCQASSSWVTEMSLPAMS
jgi:hypothetical protein